MFARLGSLVSRHWLLIILGWLVLVVTLRSIAPRWDDVTHDGDLAYLPDRVPSMVGERLLAEAFPENRSKSQIVLMVARRDEPLRSAHLKIADRLALPYLNALGAVRLEKARQDPVRDIIADRQANSWAELAAEAFDEALRIDSGYAPALHNRAIVNVLLGKDEESDRDRKESLSLSPELKDCSNQIVPNDALDLPLIDVWTRHTEVVGEKLRSKDRQAQLVILQLSNEFMQTENIRIMDRMDADLKDFRSRLADHDHSDLVIGISGSTAVGGDMLRSAKQSIRNTEWVTVALVVLILLVIYRSPPLVLVPLVTIVVSLLVSTALITLLTQLNRVPGFGWFDFKVFTTTRIFLVVILFGAGTDYCLFLISRYREELTREPDCDKANQSALIGVGDALAASALTTIVGLAMMVCAEFGKFRHSGPVIGLGLAVTLCAALTLTPALLRAFGKTLFWPFRIPQSTVIDSESNSSEFVRGGWVERTVWAPLARRIVRNPGRILIGCILLMIPLAVHGLRQSDHVMYDLLGSLSADWPSKRGSALLKEHFPIGESGPLVVLARKHQAGFDDADSQVALRAMAGIRALTGKLFELEGVTGVRSLAEPLGDPPKRMSVLTPEGRRKVVIQNHRLTKSLFLATSNELKGSVTRFELILGHNPFSKEACELLTEVDHLLQDESGDPSSFWHGSEFSYSGTTAGIRDLKSVTQSDNLRIQLLVVVAVLLVLLVILRRPVVCLFMILSVLLTYFVTLGVTDWFFARLDGPMFLGLDWKVPLFLFVILVAIGQDYNVYLATRVFEEQRYRESDEGLQFAVVRTGGIITSCGVIMAGTFLSMTSGSWGIELPFAGGGGVQGAGALKGIVQLGFALSLGVMLDTFIVRPVMLPAFLAITRPGRAGGSGS